MSERARREVLESILSSAVSTLTHRQRLCDIILMLTMGDPFVSSAVLVEIMLKMRTYIELQDLPNAWIAARIAELRGHAPLFSEPREQLVRELEDPHEARFALALAARLVSSVRRLGEGEKVLLRGLADAFRIPESEHPRLFSSWESTTGMQDVAGFQRSFFNDPDDLERRTLIWAMEQAESEDELRLIAHKMRATRYLMTKISDQAEILSLGELIPVGPYAFHADAIIEYTVANQQTVEYRRVISRFLAPGEALHPLERSVLCALVEHLDDSASVLIAHTGDLSWVDRVFVETCPPGQIRSEHLGV